MINKNQYKIANDKKILHKIGKQWVTVSAMSLALLGATSVATTVKANADTTSHNKSTVISTAPTHIQSNASNLYNKITSNNSASSKVDSGSNVANYAPASVDSKFKNLGDSKPVSTQTNSVTNQNHSITQYPKATNNNQKESLGDADNPKSLDPEYKPDQDQLGHEIPYRFHASDKMYDTPTNDYLNNVNHFSHDKNGQAIKEQIILTYGTDSNMDYKQPSDINTPKINSNVIQDLNNHQIGVLPLYNIGQSLRANGNFPSDNVLYPLMTNTNPNADVGYQPLTIARHRLIGYLFTAPRNTPFYNLFMKYFYIDSDNGYTIDTSNNLNASSWTNDTGVNSFASYNYVPRNLQFPDTPNATAEHSQETPGQYKIMFKGQTNTITFVDKATNQPIGHWTSIQSGSSNNFNYDLYHFYINISSPNTYNKSNIVLPSGYTLANSDMVKFHNTIYPPTGYVPGRFNFGRDYVIPLVKPTNDTITYTYKGKPISVWTSKTTGTTDKENSELLNIYNIITSTNAPGLPKGYWIPNSPKPSDESLAYNNYPLEKFLNTLYPAVGDTKGFHYGKHYIVPVDLIPSKQSTIKINVVPVNNHKRILNSTVVSGVVNKPFNINNYGKLIPKGWTAGQPLSSELLGNNITKFSNKNQTITILVAQSRPNGFKPAHHTYKSKITVNFLLNTNHKPIRKSVIVNGQSGDDFNINDFSKDIPSGYISTNPVTTLNHQNINQFTTYDQSINILVAINRPNGFKPNPVINVSYVDMGNHIEVKSLGTKGKINDQFNNQNYINQIPKGYHFVKVLAGNDINKYGYQPQYLIIGVKQDTSSISINYVNRLTGQLVAKGVTQTGIVGSNFNLMDTLNKMPDGYVYGGMRNSTNVFGKQDTKIDILVDKDSNKEVPLPKSSSASTSSSKAKSSTSSKASNGSSKASSASNGHKSKASSASSKASSGSSKATKPSSKASSSKSSKANTSKASSQKSKASCVPSKSIVPSSSAKLPNSSQASSNDSNQSSQSQLLPSESTNYQSSNQGQQESGNPLSSSQSMNQSNNSKAPLSSTNNRNQQPAPVAKPSTFSVNHDNTDSTSKRANFSFKRESNRSNIVNHNYRNTHVSHESVKDNKEQDQTNHGKLPQTNESDDTKIQLLSGMLILLACSGLNYLSKHHNK